MGNSQSSGEVKNASLSEKSKYKSFPGSAILEKTFCGSIDTTDPSEYEDVNFANRLLKKADIMCVSSPDDQRLGSYFEEDDDDDEDDDDNVAPKPVHPSSAMFARALVSEVTNNPKTMRPMEMAAREKQLLKAQEAAKNRQKDSTSRPVGAPGGVGPPNVLSSLAFAVTGDETAHNVCVHPTQRDTNSMMAPGPLQENRAAQEAMDDSLIDEARSPYAITIGLSLSRRHTSVGHPDTVTRQTAFDFNELQDRKYKYVSSTDQLGWRAGGGEPGGPVKVSESEVDDTGVVLQSPLAAEAPQVKVAAPDLVHIPIIQIDCQNQAAVDQVVAALASGEIFIPHMAVLPEALSVNGISPPDLVVRFGCERNEDLAADEWPNWCLEFVHNQLYEYFYTLGAKWMRRPFSITLARKVKWKTVKHMNRYFAHAERVIEGWRERGAQYLDPQASYIQGGATPEEVANPHGIYLMRHGKPTNYFAPNFDPPYTTKMTRSLLENVLGKSWDKKRREWASEPIPRLLTPNLLLSMACGCTDPGGDGFLAKEVTSSALRKSALAKSTLMQQALAADEKRASVAVALDPSGEERPHGGEEKKTDEPGVSSQSSSEKSMKLKNKGEDPSKVEHGAGSAAMSSTTVMHKNSKKTAQRILTEDWGSEKPITKMTNGSNAPEPKAEQAPAPSKQWTKKKADPRDALDEERKRSEQLLDRVKSSESSQKGKNGYNMAPGSPPGKKSVQSEVQRLEQGGVSMEYSQDESSAYFTDGNSTLLGQHIDADGSVITNNTREEMSKLAARQVEPDISDNDEDDDDGSAGSAEESATDTSFSVIPTDEELLAIGWAKALDASSGNYYYFTLDRSQIIWDNPLNMSVGPVDP